MSKEYMNDGSLSEKWKYRFNFYDQHGFPGFWGATPEYKAAFKTLKVRQRLTIQMNFIAFFCSWIYLFVLGLWKKAIIVLLLGILSLFVGALIGVNILGIAVASYVAVNTNKWFYERGKRVKYLEPLNNRWLSQAKPPPSFYSQFLRLKYRYGARPARIIKIIAPG